MKKILFCIFLYLLSFSPSFASQVLVENIFSDIDADYEYRDELQELYDRGMIIPDESGEFKPDEFLNRDEFVGISMEVICERCIWPHTEFAYIEEFSGEDIYFDVPEENPYFYCIAEADKQNYVRGYDVSESCQDGSNQFGERPFCPVNKINKEEAIAVLLRNSGIFTIEDNSEVIADIYEGNITQTLGNDVNPTDNDGNPYTFYGYIAKALDFEIIIYDDQGNEKTLSLLQPESNGDINPNEYVTKEDFLKMSYIALKSNNCSEIQTSGLALELNILDKECSAERENCPESDLDDETDTYDFEPEYETTCEFGVANPTGFIWRFQNLTTGEQFIEYGEYIDNYTLSSPGEWRIFVRVIDNCGNTSEVYNTIYVEDENLDDVPKEIDVDIDIYDDDCRAPGTRCQELEFENQEDDGDNIFDFDGDVYTSCEVGDISYNWTITHIATETVYNLSGEYIEDFEFDKSGEWLIFLEAEDGCGQTGTEQDTYMVYDENLDDVPKEIDVDIDIYDDDCSSPGLTCEEIEFENQEDDGDDIFDFDGDVYTSCEIEGVDYSWRISHNETGRYFTFSSEYIDDFEFPLSGMWTISLEVVDACGQRGSEQLNYLVITDTSSLDVSIEADPIFGYESLLVDFQAKINGGIGPYSYYWDFGDTTDGFGREISHIYLNDGLYTAILLVTDSVGNTGSATVIIQVLENGDKCLIDSDADGINNCDDLCPEIFGEEINYGCPIFESQCDDSCGCPEGYSCSDNDPLTCGAGVCLPDVPMEASCVYTPGAGNIFGSAICLTCPCNNYLDFLADIRKCDLVFPAITSPAGNNIYSRGGVWQITN